MWSVESDTDSILKSVLAGAPSVPAPITRVGNTEVRWWEGKPGDVIVMASGGSLDDRYLGEQVVVAQLEAIGYQRAHFTFDAGLSKEAGWADIMQKAKRLVQSGNVTLLRNGWNNIVAHVIGDHGEYNTEIGRDDPESRTITTWQCECPWDQYAWQRTRKWKKYEGRPCAHVLATMWKSQATPLDEAPPGGQSPTPGQALKAPPMPPGGMGGGGGGAPAGPPMPALPKPGEEAPAPQQKSFGPEEALGQSPMAPPGQGPLPTPPLDQLSQMQPPIPGATPGGMPANPSVVSVPGAKMPTPFNPIQFPGGTYSHTSCTEPDDPEWRFYRDDEDRFMHNGCGPLAHAIHKRTGWPMFATYSPEELKYRDEGEEFYHPNHVFVQHPSGQALDIRGLSPMPKGSLPISPEQLEKSFEAEAIGIPEAHLMADQVADGLLKRYSSAPEEPPNYREGTDKEHCGNCKMNNEGKCWGYGNTSIEADYVCDSWYPESKTSKTAKDEFISPEIVRLKKDGYGIAEGKSEEHGAGDYRNIPAGSEGEVLGQDPTTGWVEVIFPLNESSYMEPYHVKIFCEPGELEHTDKSPPGPFIKRR